MTSPALFVTSICLTAAAVPAYLIAEKRKFDRTKVAAKPLASLGLVGTALAAGALGSTFGQLIFAGILLSFAGDIFLLSRERIYFLGGLVSFLLAQLVYSSAFIVKGVAWLPVAAGGCILVLIGIIVYRWLRPHVPGKMIAPVLLYIVAISAMVALAMGTVWRGGPLLLLPGAAAFFVSDLSVARDRFISQGFINRIWGSPLYYMGQILIAASAGG